MFSSASNDCHYINTQDIQSIIDAWTQLIQGFVDQGWDAYLVSVLFHQLAGSRKTKIIQMNQEITRVYNRLGTRMIRDPKSPKWAKYLPIGVFVPDYPVPKFRKETKSTILDVSINDGQHMGGIILANKWGRIRSDLGDHFSDEKDMYETRKIRSIGIKPITYGLPAVVDYTFKSLKRRTSTIDDVLVLNWGGMRGVQKGRGAGSSAPVGGQKAPPGRLRSESGVKF
jgi:hypothetical protein